MNHEMYPTPVMESDDDNDSPPWSSFQGFTFAEAARTADGSRIINVVHKMYRYFRAFKDPMDTQPATKEVVALVNVCTLFEILLYFKPFMARPDFWEAVDENWAIVNGCGVTRWIVNIYSEAREKYVADNGSQLAQPAQTRVLKLSNLLAAMVDEWRRSYGDYVKMQAEGVEDPRDKLDRKFNVAMQCCSSMTGHWVKDTLKVSTYPAAIYLGPVDTAAYPGIPSYSGRAESSSSGADADRSSSSTLTNNSSDDRVDRVGRSSFSSHAGYLAGRFAGYLTGSGARARARYSSSSDEDSADYDANSDHVHEQDDLEESSEMDTDQDDNMTIRPSIENSSDEMVTDEEDTMTIRPSIEYSFDEMDSDEEDTMTIRPAIEDSSDDLSGSTL